MTSSGLKDFVPFPRQVLADRKSGKLTPNEYELYMFVRHGGNPYGVASVSLEGLFADFSHHKWKDKNYVNKLLLSLRSKRYLHYDDRTGRRGSFEVRFPEFFTPTGGTTRLPDDAKTSEDRRLVPDPITTGSEVRQSITPLSPRSDVKKDGEIRSVGEIILAKGRGPYTDTNTDKENNRSLKSSFKNTPSSFKPTGHKEETCRSIALELGEASMDYLLGILHKHGFDVIEGAWGVYRQDVKDKGAIRNKPAYFNKIIAQRVEGLARGKKEI